MTATYKVFDSSGELVYALRPAQAEFQPPVFAAGRYTLLVSDPESGRNREIKDLEAIPENSRRIAVLV